LRRASAMPPTSGRLANTTDLCGNCHVHGSATSLSENPPPLQ
jgi:hypothetical protein